MVRGRGSPTISRNGHADLTDAGENDTFFSNPEVAENVFKAVREFAEGADTITLEELRSEVAQSSTAR